MKKMMLSLLALFLLSLSPAHAAQYIDSQMGENGVDVHVTKARVLNGVLGVTLLYVNNTKTSYQPGLKLKAEEVFLLAGQKKYQILKDLQTNEWLAAPLVKARLSDKIFLGPTHLSAASKYREGEKKVSWLKFPAPPAGVNTVELLIPGVSPFTFNIIR